MRTRSSRPRRVAQLGQTRPRYRGRAALILSVPVISLLLPALAVAIASAGGASELTRTAAGIARFLLYYSGVFALVALSAAVAAGLLATDRTMLTADRRIFAQALHRTTSLIGVAALANHIMLEVLAHRASVTDGLVPFMAARSTFYMGLGTIASDLFVIIIVTGVLRRRFSKGARRWGWRAVHVTAYAAWPMAVLHGLLAGRSARPYVDWSYGGCLAAVALALTFRYVVALRGRNAPGPVGPHRPRPATAPPASLPALPGPAGGLQPLPYRPVPVAQPRALLPGPQPPGWRGRPAAYPDPGYGRGWPAPDPEAAARPWQDW